MAILKIFYSDNARYPTPISNTEHPYNFIRLHEMFTKSSKGEAMFSLSSSTPSTISKITQTDVLFYGFSIYLMKKDFYKLSLAAS